MDSQIYTTWWCAFILRRHRLTMVLLLTLPLLVHGASKDVEKLRARIADMRSQITELQRTQDSRMQELSTLAQQALAASLEANTAVASIPDEWQKYLRFQGTKLVNETVGAAARMDGISVTLRLQHHAIADLTDSFAEIRASLTICEQQLRSALLSAPRPPLQVGLASEQEGARPPIVGDPRVSGEEIWANAEKHRSTGELQSAIEEYQEYLRFYGSADLAAGVQFRIAFIHFAQGKYKIALDEIENTSEKYPDSTWIPIALYYKGLSLTKLNLQSAATDAFNTLIQHFPNHSISREARAQIALLRK